MAGLLVTWVVEEEQDASFISGSDLLSWKHKTETWPEAEMPVTTHWNLPPCFSQYLFIIYSLCQLFISDIFITCIFLCVFLFCHSARWSSKTVFLLWWRLKQFSTFTTVYVYLFPQKTKTNKSRTSSFEKLKEIEILDFTSIIIPKNSHISFLQRGVSKYGFCKQANEGLDSKNKNVFLFCCCFYDGEFNCVLNHQ